MKTRLMLLALLSLCLTAPFAAKSEPCPDRDMQSLVFPTNYPPMYRELLCQFKLVLKARTDSYSLRNFVDLSAENTGVSSANLNWEAPTTKIIAELINKTTQSNGNQKLAQSAQKFFFQSGRYMMSAEETKLIGALSSIEIQTH